MHVSRNGGFQGQTSLRTSMFWTFYLMYHFLDANSI